MGLDKKLNLSAEAAKALREELDKGDGALKKMDAAAGDMLSSLNSVRTAATGMVEAFMGGFGNITLGGIIEHTNKMSEYSAEMNKATGAAGQLSESLREHRKSAEGMAVGYQELTKHQTAVFLGMTDFTKLSPKARGELAGLASKLTKLGISAEDTAKNLDIMTKGLGMSWKEAKKTQMDIAKVGRALGVAPAKMAKDFAASAPKLAAYGKRGFEVFKKLASQAKATGMEMTDLLGITDKFDTFEGAAQQTAQLNAVMGTTINSVDMLMATEDERVQILKQSVTATGKSWDSMARYERKALANIVTQGDLTKAAKLFGTTQEDMQDQAAKADPALVSQEALNNAMKRGVSRAQAFAAMLEGIKSKFAAAIMPLVNKFVKFFIKDALPKMTWFLDKMTKEWLPWLERKLKDVFGEGEGFKDMLGWIVGIAVAVGPFLGVLGAFVPILVAIGSLVAAIFSPWALVVLGIAAAVGTLLSMWEGMHDSFAGFFGEGGSWDQMLGGFMDTWGGVWESVKLIFKDVFAEISGIFSDVGVMMGVTVEGQGTNWRKLGETIAKIIGTIMGAVGKMALFLSKKLKGVTENMKGMGVSFETLFGPGGADILFGTFGAMFIDSVALPIAKFLDKILFSSEYITGKVAGLLGIEGGIEGVRTAFGLTAGTGTMTSAVEGWKAEIADSVEAGKASAALAASVGDGEGGGAGGAGGAGGDGGLLGGLRSLITPKSAAPISRPVLRGGGAGGGGGPAQARFNLYVDRALLFSVLVQPEIEAYLPERTGT